MKTLSKSLPLLIGLLSFSMACYAGETEKTMESMGGMKMQPGMGKQQGMGMGMGMGGAMTEEQKEQHLRAMQDHMLKMHDLSDKILAETNPAKKDELKNQQLQLMKEHHAKMMEHRMQKMQHRQQKQAAPAVKK
ncbi:MAG: hypothetical protein ACU84H_13795 [Gammaproteobacteria bacterium]